MGRRTRPALFSDSPIGTPEGVRPCADVKEQQARRQTCYETDEVGLGRRRCSQLPPAVCRPSPAHALPVSDDSPPSITVIGSADDLRPLLADAQGLGEAQLRGEQEHLPQRLLEAVNPRALFCGREVLDAEVADDRQPLGSDLCDLAGQPLRVLRVHRVPRSRCRPRACARGGCGVAAD